MSSSLEAKIVVLGAQGVGKTSLVSRYVQNSFSPSTTTSTVGASFITKRVLDSASDTIVRLQIWDTAGQERFRSISRLYYRGANACLLCYDITSEQSFQEMTGWLTELKNNLVDPDEDPIVIHVVGTKTDIVTLDPGKRRVPFERTIAYVADQLFPARAGTPPVTAGLGSASTLNTLTGGAGGGGDSSKRSSAFWGQDIGWDCCHEISAKDGEGVEEVFRVITRKLVEQRNKREAALALAAGGSNRTSMVFDGLSVMGGNGGADGDGGVDGNGSFRLGYPGGAGGGGGDKRRSWLGFPPSSVGDGVEDGVVERGGGRRRGGGGCC